jgi:hypothetical protein
MLMVLVQWAGPARKTSAAREPLVNRSICEARGYSRIDAAGIKGQDIDALAKSTALAHAGDERINKPVPE